MARVEAQLQKEQSDKSECQRALEEARAAASRQQQAYEREEEEKRELEYERDELKSQLEAKDAEVEEVRANLQG